MKNRKIKKCIPHIRPLLLNQNFSEGQIFIVYKIIFSLVCAQLCLCHLFTVTKRIFQLIIDLACTSENTSKTSTNPVFMRHTCNIFFLRHSTLCCRAASTVRSYIKIGSLERTRLPIFFCHILMEK